MVEGINIYQRSLRSNVRGLWLGVIDYDQFVEAMEAAIRRRLTQAWHDGARECGIMPDELSLEEEIALRSAITNELAFIDKLATEIEENNKKSGGKLGPLLTRLGAWAQRYLDLQNRAKIMACKDKKLIWVVNHAKESCRSCLRLENKVKRASYWQRVGIKPQSPPNDKLECGGWLCGCELRPTDKAASRGPLPKVP